MTKAKTARNEGKSACCITGQNKPLLAALLAETRDFCAARRGRASALAADLGVKQQQASTWLLGKAEPGGEATLQIVAWLHREREAEADERARLVNAAPARLAAAMRSVATTTP